ncbi:MAG: hypothetical protein HY260_11650 [Chloroflexi bacterium]|nr:hypothetical protein [Chloroflexota bacterium]
MIERIAYRGWPNCYRLSNDRLELIATSDVGPRLVHFGFAGRRNELGGLDEQFGRMGGDEWQLYGGHRFWHAPEDPQRNYLPDNSPIEVATDGDTLTLTQPAHPTLGIRKTIAVILRADRLELTHTLINTGAWPVELAPWALTIMAAGGVGIAPVTLSQPPYSLLPDRAIVIWPYAGLDDPRVRWGHRFITVRHDRSRSAKFKFGLTAPDGWLAYLRDGNLFVKTFDRHPDARYPDLGSAIEIFTDDRILELETLGPLVILAPGASASHSERWFLFDGVKCDPNDDDSIATNILPLVERAGA